MTLNATSAWGSVALRTRALARCILFGILVLPSPTIAQLPARFDLVRDFTIGRDDGDERYVFAKVLAVRSTPDASIVVEDVGQRLRLFGPDGAFIRFIGRRGGGPGEFKNLSAIGLLQDTLWTADVSLRRTTLMRLDGSAIRTLSWDDKPPAGAALATTADLVGGLFADGTAWGESNKATAGMFRGAPQLPHPVLRLSRNAHTMDTVAIIPTTHETYYIVDQGSINFGQQKFPDAPIIADVAQMSRLYIVYREAATSARPTNVRVIALQSTGDTIWSRNLPYAPRALEKAVSDSIIKRTIDVLRRDGTSENAARRALFVPDFRPPVTSAFAADDGALWLRREEGRATVEYWVVAPDGVLRVRTVVPQSVKLLAARGPLVWGVERDDNDVHTVVRFHRSN